MQPSLLNGETEGIALLTQFNPHGLFIALEEIGFLLMSVSFLFLAPVFAGRTRLEAALCWLFINDLLFMPDALLMGQKTYAAFAGIWPARQGKDADRINSMPKYVASRTLKEPLTWNATLIKGDAVEEIRKLKQEPGKGLLQYGVGALTHTLLKAGLVDEFRILVYPFTFGEGPYIFEHMGVNPLKLLETKTFNSGTVALHYQPS